MLFSPLKHVFSFWIENNYFGKNDHGTELRSNFPHKASVCSEPLDVSFIAAVEENGTQTLSTNPVLGVNKVTLTKRGEFGKAEMVETLFEVTNFVLVLLLLHVLV